jgi:hypothetical protein
MSLQLAAEIDGWRPSGKQANADFAAALALHNDKPKTVNHVETGIRVEDGEKIRQSVKKAYAYSVPLLLGRVATGSERDLYVSVWTNSLWQLTPLDPRNFSIRTYRDDQIVDWESVVARQEQQNGKARRNVAVRHAPPHIRVDRFQYAWIGVCFEENTYSGFLGDNAGTVIDLSPMAVIQLREGAGETETIPAQRETPVEDSRKIGELALTA